MISRRLFVLCAIVCCGIAVALSQGVGNSNIPFTKFTCQGRPSGYYADVETGCQVYHMCDGLGRQFSYTCPNTTLFQQRMLICDHWYMVNCSKSESDYDANLLIGQRDKPFVSEADMRLRTPRPDILSVPPNSNYYDGLREAESKYPVHPGNSIVGVPDSISSANNNGLDSGKQQYRPPTSWSTKRPPINNQITNNPKPSTNVHEDNIAGAASQKPKPTFKPIPDNNNNFNHNTIPKVTPPSQDLSPPFAPSTTTEPTDSEEFDIDMRMKSDNDPVFQFIKRFDPNSPTSHKTSMTTDEILRLNQQLPQGPEVSAEEDRTPRKNKNTGNFNTVEENKKSKVAKEPTRFDSVNIKPTSPTGPLIPNSNIPNNGVPVPDRHLLPPKTEFHEQPSTTNGPPIYYEWKWAVPAFDLEPPKISNITYNETEPQGRNAQGISPFRSVTRPTPTTVHVTPANTEYNISSYFVPDYIFPLDKPHPGYGNEGVRTSFQVDKENLGNTDYLENPNCPQCDPAYLKPGTCEPCIVRR